MVDNIHEPHIQLTTNLQFLQQYVDNVVDFTSYYNNLSNVSYSPNTIIGKPARYPQYGDFPDTYMLRPCGKWWSTSKSKQCNYMPQDTEEIISEDYLVVRFREAVIPKKLEIFETFNPGSIVRIYGKSGSNWFLLFEQPPEDTDLIPAETSRCFTPKLRVIHHLVSEIRLEFNQSKLKYNTALDAIRLSGFRPTNDIEYIRMIRALHRNVKTERSEVVRTEGVNYFDLLPDEILLYIFKFLDVKSLMRCSQVCPHFTHVTSDATLYQNLSLKRYWMKVDSTTISFFTARCNLLKRLDISWCGANSYISERQFVDFLRNCGRNLTHLSLCHVLFIDSLSLRAIGELKNLTDLRLRNCRCNPFAFMYLCNLATLESLDVSGTKINTEILINLAKSNRDLKHLIIDYCDNMMYLDKLLHTLAMYNQQLVTLSCWKVRTLTTVVVEYLSYLRNLEEIDMGWCLEWNESHSLKSVAEGCQKLRRLNVSHWRGLDDNGLRPILSNCKGLEQLHLMGVPNITGDVIEFALANLPNLQMLDLTYCINITQSMVTGWRLVYPHITMIYSS